VRTDPTSRPPSLYSFYPTEYLANEAKKVAGEEFVVRPGLKRFGNNDEFVAHKNQEVLTRSARAAYSFDSSA
jgi:hypothetical protein